MNPVSPNFKCSAEAEAEGNPRGVRNVILVHLLRPLSQMCVNMSCRVLAAKCCCIYIYNMRFTTCCALVGASLLAASNLFAQVTGTGSLYITAPNFGPDQAGPYVVQNVNVASGVNPGSTFLTFCIGSQVDYYPSSTYTYQISSQVAPNTVSPGFVTWGTAYLYSQFLSGGAGQNTDITTTSAKELNDALQVAIWDLQGQITSGITYSAPSVNMTDVTNFLNAAASAATSAGVNDEANANGAFGVYALNMYSGTQSMQPELVQVPVPEPSTVLAGAVLLAPLGISTLRLVRKHRKAQRVV